MAKNKVELPGGWEEVLRSGSQEACLALVPRLEQGDDPAVIPLLGALLHRADFPLKYRIFIAFSRLKQPAACPLLCGYMAAEKQTHWRLAALEGAAASTHPRAIALLTPFLEDEDALFLRGIVWALGSLGPGAFSPLADFTAGEGRDRVRGEVLAEALFLAAGKDSSHLKAAFPQRPALRRFWQNRLLPQEPLPKYHIYPYPDYLWEKAQEAGVSKKEFQRLRFWYRPPQ